MKNILLGTSALVGAALLASAALAEDPKVMVGGVIDFQAGYTDDDSATSSNDIGFRNDTEINISVEGKSDHGLGYGAVIDLEADVSGAARNQGFNAARTYTFLDGSFGRIEMGSVEGATQTMQVDAATIARATGGINGDFDMFVSGNNTAAYGAGSYFNISRGALPAYHGDTTRLGGDDTTDNSAKVTYYSPRFSGFQAGVSYTPNSNSRGAQVSTLDTSNAYSNVVDAALSYEGQFSNVGVKAAFAYEWGQDEGLTGAFGTPSDLNAWNAGASVNFMGVNLAGSYGDWDDALGASTDSDYYTLGAAYDFGPFGASVTWLDSEVDLGAGLQNDFNNLVFGVDYALAPGLTPYAEVSLFDASNDTGTSNDGTIALVGAQLAF